MGAARATELAFIGISVFILGSAKRAAAQTPATLNSDDSARVFLTQARTAQAPRSGGRAKAAAEQLADIVFEPEPIAVTNGVRAWRASLRTAGGERVEKYGDSGGLARCREVSELPGVVLCQSYLELDLNKLFGRASLYAEGGYELKSRTVASHDHLDMRKGNLLTQGHNLKSTDLKQFFKAVGETCAQGIPRSCMNPSELAFYRRVFMPMAKKYKEFVVLGFSLQSFDSYQSNLGHELMHAQFFTDPAYRQVVFDYWIARVPDSEKARIREELRKKMYDPSDELLMQNEFQAYILEPDANEAALKEFVSAHSQALLRALEKAGCPPIRVQ